MKSYLFSILFLDFLRKTILQATFSLVSIFCVGNTINDRVETQIIYTIRHILSLNCRNFDRLGRNISKQIAFFVVSCFSRNISTRSKAIRIIRNDNKTIFCRLNSASHQIDEQNESHSCLHSQTITRNIFSS